jgi:hypothetical protein
VEPSLIYAEIRLIPTKNYQKLIKPCATLATNKLKTSAKILLAIYQIRLGKADTANSVSLSDSFIPEQPHRVACA